MTSDPPTGSVALAVNAGSSTVKCALFTYDAAPRCLARHTIDATSRQCMPLLHDWMHTQLGSATLCAIGHRVVHGGPHHRAPQSITSTMMSELAGLVPFAPNHLPDEIALIEALQHEHPSVPQVACFDTAFHHDLPEIASRLPIPVEYHERGIRRYGFHGLSYAYLLEELTRLDAAAGRGRIVVAHLGNGSSLAAIRDGRSIDTTMAFTPIGGVVMSTRSGDLDPGVVTYLARTERLSPDAVEDILSQRSGLLAISGTTSDMQRLLAREADDRAARLAVEMYVYAVAKSIGALAVALDGIDTLVFSAGIGEHAAAIRERICHRLTHLGMQVDDSLNAVHAAVISTAGSGIVVRVIPTDEELMIARATFRVVASRGADASQS